METVHSVIMKSSSGCVIELCGSRFELLPNVPAAAPLGADGSLLFTVWGFAEDGFVIPALHRIETAGRISSTLPLIDWGGVFEVQVEPLVHRPYRYAPPELIDSADFRFKEGRARAELYTDGGLRLAVTPAAGSAFSIPLGEGRGGRLRPLDLGRETVLAVLAETGTGMRLIILDRSAEIMLDEAGDIADIYDGHPAVIRRIPSVRGYERRIGFELGRGGFYESASETGFFTAEEHEPRGEAEIALSFVQELKLSKTETLMRSLSHDLRNESALNELAAFLGEYDTAALYPLEEPEGRVTVGLLMNEGRIRSARKFLFRFEQALITDIEEL